MLASQLGIRLILMMGQTVPLPAPTPVMNALSRVEVTNDDSVEHNFTFEQAGANQDVEGGENATVTFTAPAAGSYEFFCKYHAQGMRGTVTAGRIVSGQIPIAQIPAMAALPSLTFAHAVRATTQGGTGVR